MNATEKTQRSPEEKRENNGGGGCFIPSAVQIPDSNQTNMSLSTLMMSLYLIKTRLLQVYFSI